MDLLKSPWWRGMPFQTGVIAAGVILRLGHLLENRSFWQDEICLALSIVHRTFAEMGQNHILFPDFAQAPLFFQVIVKCFVALFGNNEIAIRLFPFLAAVGALVLAARFFRRYLDEDAAALALVVIALAEPMIYFAAEIKPYGIDLLMVFVVYELFQAVEDRALWPRYLWLALGGAAVVWLSNAMLFVLFGCGAVAGGWAIWRRDRTAVLALTGCALVWGASFGLLYTVSLSKMLNASLVGNWAFAFPKGPVFSMDGLVWLRDAFLAMFLHPLGLAFPWVMGGLFIVGGAVIFRRDKKSFALLAAPLLVTLLLGAFKKYPFYERLILFLVPGALAFVAAGAVLLARRAAQVHKVFSFAVIVVICWGPVGTAVYHLAHGRGFEDNREVVAYLAGHYQPGDTIFVATQAQYPLWYYGERFGLGAKLARAAAPGPDGLKAVVENQLFSEPRRDHGVDTLVFRRVFNFYDEQGHFKRFVALPRVSDVQMVPASNPAPLKGLGRVWLLLSHIDDPDYPAFVRGFFARVGPPLASFEKKGAGVTLYRF